MPRYWVNFGEVEHAALNGDTATLEAWLETPGNDPNAKDVNGYSLFFHAVLGGSLAAARTLLEHGARVDASPSSGCLSLLTCAAVRGRCEIMLEVLAHGAQVDDRDCMRLTDLDGNHHECFSGPTTLWATANCHYYRDAKDTKDTISLLLSRGASLEFKLGSVTAEQKARENLETFENWREPRAHSEQKVVDAARACYSLLCAVRLAGGWRRFVNAPRASVLVLRQLYIRGRAVPPQGSIFNILLNPLMPDAVAMHVLKFWRTERDSRY